MERGNNPLAGEVEMMEAIQRLKSVNEKIQELASQIPPLSPERIHALVESNRLSQFQLRRRADRYLLALCLCLLALAASILWHTSSAGASPLNIAILVLAIADLFVAIRAAFSLWLMRQTVRLRHRPYRMARYADLLNRLSKRRHLWLRFVLRGSYGDESAADSRRLELVSLRIPSYSIAACLLLLVALNADKAYAAATTNRTDVFTTSGKSDEAICDTVKKIISNGNEKNVQ